MKNNSEAQTRQQMEQVHHPDLGNFILHGRQWSIHPDVFSPEAFPSTGFFASAIDYPEGGRFLEIGCGAGVIATLAAIRGAAHVLASDISPDAVANAAVNARRHHVQDRVQVVESDLFDSLASDNRFDVIFWNSNFVAMPSDYTYAHTLERAFFDPGYAQHQRYLAQVHKWLRPGGTALLGFSSLGDPDLLADACAQANVTTEVVSSWSSQERPPVTYHLMKISANHRQLSEPVDKRSHELDD